MYDSITRLALYKKQKRQVIVVSENMGLLSSVVLALAALVRPLLWVHPLVPVMPMDMGELLSAPVPYLIGERRAWRVYVLYS